MRFDLVPKQSADSHYKSNALQIHYCTSNMPRFNSELFTDRDCRHKVGLLANVGWCQSCPLISLLETARLLHSIEKEWWAIAQSDWFTKLWPAIEIGRTVHVFPSMSSYRLTLQYMCMLLTNSMLCMFRVKEDVFWRNYFYRVSLIKQSAQLTALAAQQQAVDHREEQKTISPEGVSLTGNSVCVILTRP